MSILNVVTDTIVVQTAAQWAVDATPYINRQILVTSDAYYGSTDFRKFKIADGTQTWAQLQDLPFLTAVPTLAQILNVGDLTGEHSIFSNNNQSYLSILNASFAYGFDDGAGGDGYGQVTPTEHTIQHSVNVELTSPSVTKNGAEIETVAPRLIGTRQFATLTNAGPADGATVYIGQVANTTPTATATNRQFSLATGVIRSASINFMVNTTLGSSENITVNLRNVTDSTSDLIGVLPADAIIKSLVATGLSITTNIAKQYAIELVYPTWVTNPTNVQFSFELDIYNA